jgi:hypothetical protein
LGARLLRRKEMAGAGVLAGEDSVEIGNKCKFFWLTVCPSFRYNQKQREIKILFQLRGWKEKKKRVSTSVFSLWVKNYIKKVARGVYFFSAGM